MTREHGEGRARVVITTGGTIEPIDDVRSIGNSSTGRFGYAIARCMVDRSADVTVLCRREVPALAGFRLPGVEHVNFTSAESLQQALLGQETPDIIFHAAAVADFRPKDVVNGKIPSTQDEMTITLVRNPKILDQLRGRFGQTVFLVGFKLSSGVPRSELIRAALEQNQRAHLNLTFANDKSELKGRFHPGILVTAEGGAIDLKGTFEEVAGNFVEFVRKRAAVTWYHTEADSYLPEPPEEDQESFAALLKFAQRSHLLYDASGNVSQRFGDFMIVTPRQVEKSVAKPEEACVVSVDQSSNYVYYRGRIKSSIDTGVNDALYCRFPNIRAMLHFHTPWGLAPYVTSFPYPCGVKEEAQEIMRQLGDSYDRDSFAVELLHHGFLLGLPEAGLERLQEGWDNAVREFRTHLIAVNQQEAFEPAKLKPVFCDTEIVGVVMEDTDGSVVYLREKARGKGVGRKVAEQLIERQLPVQTMDDCNVVEFYKKYGFTGERHPQTGIYTLYPPRITSSDKLFDRISEWRVE